MTDEYIRKQDAVDEINTNADDLEQNGSIPFAQGARAMAIVVEQMSPADVAPVAHGRWIDADSHLGYFANCSACGYQMDVHAERGYFNFCPNCGAKMDGGY